MSDIVDALNDSVEFHSRRADRAEDDRDEARRLARWYFNLRVCEDLQADVADGYPWIKEASVACKREG
jgi:hypothetical protein